METEIKQSIENIGKSFDEFKKANDERLSQLEKKGATDPLTESKLDKINDYLDQQVELKDRLEKLETTSSADFAESVEKSENKEVEYKNAFLDYAKKGIEHKALLSASDPDGGYTVPVEMSSKITKKIFETSPIRQVANVVTISTDQFEELADYDEAVATWTSEQGARPETGTPQLKKKIISVHELYAKPKATQNLLDDSALNMESWLSDKIADKFRRTENAAFINGDGAGKPRGILTYADGETYGKVQQISSNSTTGGQLASEDMIELLYSLKEDYQANATFLMNRSTLKEARKLKGSDGQYYFVPALSQGAFDTILGKNVVQCDDMPELATNSLSIAIGDFSRAYQIVDRQGVRVLRDPYSSKPFIEFYTTKRTGGDVLNFEAIKLLKMDA